MVIRNWRDETPYVGHDNVIIHRIFDKKGGDGRSDEQAPLGGNWSMARQAIQGGKKGDYHSHDNIEQVFYFTKGRGQMKLNDQIYDVRDGDAVHVPPGCKHQTINSSEDWLELLIITASVES